jgi:hypothetical protein
VDYIITTFAFELFGRDSCTYGFAEEEIRSAISRAHASWQNRSEQQIIYRRPPAGK